MSLTCIGANPWPYHGKLVCFREDSTDFELGVLGHLTDSCEIRLDSCLSNMFRVRVNRVKKCVYLPRG